MMNIASFLAAADEPDRPALVFPGPPISSTTFRELDELSSRLATGLNGLGLSMNDRVIIFLPISLKLYVSLIALFKLGATAVFLDPGADWRQLDRTAAQVAARAFIGTRKAMWLRSFLPALHRIPHGLPAEGASQKSLGRLMQTHAPQIEIREVEPETPALITFTAGSTNVTGPRGVVRTHRLLAAQHASIARALPALAADVDLPSFPILTLHNLAMGIPSLIPDFPFRCPEAIRPERVLRQILAGHATTASGSPIFWGAIAGYCLEHGLTLSLRRIVVGGAPLMPNLVHRLKQAAPEAELLNVYGSTEAEPVALISADEILSKTSALTAAGAGIPLGHPVSDICVKILNDHGEEQGVGSTGEIWVSGEHVARGYFANPQADTLNKHSDTQGRLWHRMGDFGYSDMEGRLWLVGRVNTTVERDGHLLYPLAVEAAVGTLPYVRRAALVGMPDDKLKERTLLLVEFNRGGARPADWQDELKVFCADRGWLVDEVRPVRRLPVDPRHNARIDHARLKAMLNKQP